MIANSLMQTKFLHVHVQCVFVICVNLNQHFKLK